MSTDNIFDDILSAQCLDGDDSVGAFASPTAISGNVHWHEPEYQGEIDYRIRQLSYSSLGTLHSCPRKFELYKRRSTHRTEESLQSTITFAFGHVIGAAIQSSFLENKSKEDIIWEMFLGWHTDLFAIDEKAKKSFWYAVIAVERLIAMKEAGLFKEYELVYFNGKPAIELSFCISFPDGFRLRGFVDAVLRHKLTGKIVVLECKTTGLKNLDPAMYKNSNQAIGYSVVLDSIVPDLSAYEVLYLVYQTSSLEYTILPFQKTTLMRAEWLQDILMDIESIKMYEKQKYYPKRGESCFSFFRQCEYFNTCHMSTEYLTAPCTAEEEDKFEYQFDFTFEELIHRQLEKSQ